MTSRVRNFLLIAGVLLVAAGVVGWIANPYIQAIRVGAGVVSHTLCSGVFVSGLDPDRLFDEALKPSAGMRRLSKRLKYVVDRPGREVVVTWAGWFRSRAVYRDGLGCILIHDGEPSAFAAAADLRSQPEAVPLEVEPRAAKLESALDYAFAESAAPPYRAVKAIVILHHGRIVAERYAPGYAAATPIHGFSLAKSVTNALVGVLVREGKLSIDKPAPVPEWRDQADPRHNITLDQLMRMASGLALDESDSGFDPVSRMLFLEPDMAGFAARARLQLPPGTTWNYSSGNTLIVSRVIRDAVGGRAEDVVKFARKELFEPLGISTATIEFDSTGTPIGSQYMFASARDWARFGTLYLNDGVVGSKRILPEGWVDYSTTPTLDSAYGAGFWTNRGSNPDAVGRVRSGMPADAFYGSGNLGQRIVVAPAAGLVVVRMGFTHRPGFDMKGLVRLVAEAVSATNHP